MDAAGGGELSLAAVRDALVRLEDSVVFALIERARHPRNAPAYAPAGGGGRSLVEFYVREAEALDAKASFFLFHASLVPSFMRRPRRKGFSCPDGAGVSLLRFRTSELHWLHEEPCDEARSMRAQAGHYQKPEDVPFFPQDLPSTLFPTKSSPQVLHPLASLVTVNDAIWKMYFDELLPLFTVDGDDGSYAETVALDFACLQDSNSLMDLLTFKAVEEKVKKRVEKKGRTFGQNVTLEDNAGGSGFKIDPTVLSKLYDQWVMPLTKDVEVEYLLRRLD
nr:unnamed protein product [Digitaria exilis]